jgi:hypothetical protein
MAEARHAVASIATSSSAATASVPPPSATATPVREEAAEHLRLAQSLLEREIARTDLAPHETEPLREVLFALRERNLPRVATVYRDAFREIVRPTDGLRQAVQHLDRYFNH